MFNTNSKRFIAIVIVFLLLLELTLCQRSRPKPKKPKNRNRNRNRKKTADTIDHRIKCLSCYADMRLKFNPSNLCYNPYQNATQADILFLTQCSPFSRYCTVDISRINSVLAVIDRRCGPPDPPVCSHFCISKSYGVDTTVCTYCCTSKVNEDDDNYDEDLHANYTCPNEPH